ncbi:helix-turn-helix domain-containing protein [Planococcus sp. APC 3906]|uniref:helix-turn-helix domain-containing protein n=1 Tax=Planococcus TaxID=1372 RepID=UPI0025B34C34|nr:helix-turn-helix transcriptional regulator [Planococcus sp. APC 3906]MDN3450331.1 helix-turn-helix transcriptional regulator [Planococcus sp. APC 3906]
MDTGLRLKYHRLKKKISLEEAASGIITPRELKKIETGAKEPALKELEALCKKLEIPLAPKDNPVGKVLVKNFKTSLLHPQNKGKIMELYSDIHDHPLLHVNEDIELEYNIQQIRYFIITGDLDSAEEKLKSMEHFKEFMDQEQFYLFHKYNGNYHYILSDFEAAFKIYLMAEKIAPHSLSSTEKGDLFYSLGITASQLYYTEMAFKYTELALNIYQQEFIPKRIVECHLNMGITHTRLRNYQTSRDHYKTALTIGRRLDIEILKFTTEYNLGYCYFLNQSHELTITHMENALKYIPNEYTADKLLTFCFLIISEYELGNIEKAKSWGKEGLEIIESKNLSLNSPTKDTFKEAYIEFMCLIHFLSNDYEKFEYMTLHHLFPSLENHNNFFEMGYFYNHLGNVYYEQGLFEKSASALKKSQKAYRNTICTN